MEAVSISPQGIKAVLTLSRFFVVVLDSYDRDKREVEWENAVANMKVSLKLTII